MERYDRIRMLIRIFLFSDSAPIYLIMCLKEHSVIRRGVALERITDRFLHNDFIDYVKHYNTLMQSNNDYPSQKNGTASIIMPECSSG